MSGARHGIRTVLVAGAGTMGKKIAVDCLQHGLSVKIYDVRPGALDNATEVAQRLCDVLDPENREEHIKRNALLKSLQVETDLQRAATDVDLVIECIPERLLLKEAFFRTVSRICPPHVILTSNTSTFLPSRLSQSVEHPERFAALHFTLVTFCVEIMGHAGTSPEVLDRLRTFAGQIAHYPIFPRRENRGYVMNVLLGAIHYASISLVANGIASVEDVDRIFMMIYNTKFGPLAGLDCIGLDIAQEITALDAALSRDPQLLRNIEFLKEYVEQGRCGIKTGRGFYEYPVPSFRHPEFLTPPSAPESPAPKPPRSALLRPVSKAAISNGSSDVFECLMDPEQDGFWRDHVFKETPLLPGASMIELFAQAARECGVNGPVTLRDVKFLNPIRAFNTRPQKLLLEVHKDEAQWRLELFQELRNQADKVLDPHRLCASARVDLSQEPWPAAPTHDAPLRWGDVRHQSGGANYLGPAMQGLRAMGVGHMTGEGQIVVDPMNKVSPHRPDGQWVYHVPLIDGALVACSLFTEQKLNGTWQIPTSVGLVRLDDPPPPGAMCTTRFRAIRFNEAERQSEYRIWLMGPDGKCSMYLEEYCCRLMPKVENPMTVLEYRDVSAALSAGR